MTPSTGLTPCASAAGAPLAPLTSAYESTAVMNAWPTSGPSTTSRMTHAREVASSRDSLLNRVRNTTSLGEREKDVFDVAVRTIGSRTQLVERPLTHDSSVAQQDQAITNPRRIMQLVDRQEERPPPRGDATKEWTD